MVKGTKLYMKKFKQHEYRAIHTAIVAVWGKPKKCEMCNNKRGSKRMEWSNKDHKYTLLREDWWQLCAKCHREYDGKIFHRKPPWNKGLYKKKEPRICEWCGKEFIFNRLEQRFCNSSCSSKHNWDKQRRLKENKKI